MTRFKAFSALAVLSEQERKEGLARFNPTPDTESPSFRLLWFDPGACTPRHNHTETELWTVLRGKVEVDVEGTCVTLETGSLITLSPLQHHDIRSADAPAVLSASLFLARPNPVRGGREAIWSADRSSERRPFRDPKLGHPEWSIAFRARKWALHFCRHSASGDRVRWHRSGLCLWNARAP